MSSARHRRHTRGVRRCWSRSRVRVRREAVLRRHLIFYRRGQGRLSGGRGDFAKNAEGKFLKVWGLFFVFSTNPGYDVRVVFAFRRFTELA